MRDLLLDGAGLVLVTDLKIAAEEVHDRKVGRGRAVRDSASLQDQPAGSLQGVGDLPDEPRLPDSRLPDERDDLAVARLGPGQRVAHLLQLGLPADEGRHGAARRQAGLLEPVEPIARSSR